MKRPLVALAFLVTLLFNTSLSSKVQSLPESNASEAPTYFKIPAKPEGLKSGPSLITNTGYGVVFIGSKEIVRSPTYEFVLGYQAGPYVNIGCSYLFQQAPLKIQMQGSAIVEGALLPLDYAINSNFRFQALAFKATFSPKPLTFWIFKLNPYCSLGAGQTWMNMLMEFKPICYLCDIGLSAGTSILSAQAGLRYNHLATDAWIQSVIGYVGLQLSF